jgi:hypothetical protein
MKHTREIWFSTSRYLQNISDVEYFEEGEGDVFGWKKVN